METVNLVSRLFIFGIISIILNSVFALAFLASYIGIIVLDVIYAVEKYKNQVNSTYYLQISYIIVAAVLESAGLLGSIACSILILFGSCSGIKEDRNKRMKGHNLSSLSVIILLIQIALNIFVMGLTFMSDAYVNGSSLLDISGSVLVIVIFFQCILLTYNAVFTYFVRDSFAE